MKMIFPRTINFSFLYLFLEYFADLLEIKLQTCLALKKLGALLMADMFLF